MFSVYVHVPFCVRRCGYCDFNTYTAKELGGGASQDSYADMVISELRLWAAGSASVESGAYFGMPGLTEAPFAGAGPVETVFFGGGTPTLLPPADLVRILAAIDDAFGLAVGAEVTTEANPDSVSEASISELAAGGFNRISLGMQSAVPAVLRNLDRTHDPAQVSRAVEWARAAGMRVSLDLIYGTPGESLADWRVSVEAALATGVDHISAYALTLEPHTKMGRRVERGELPAPDDYDEAAKYELADRLFEAAGLQCYEISNWARGGINGPNACQHNLVYWRGQSWLGLGPGAHSHSSSQLNGTRWWNVAHPVPYSQRVADGALPIAGFEQLTTEQAALERVMLGLRVADGLPMEALESSTRPEATAAAASSSAKIAALIADGLIDGQSAIAERRLVLTRKGRLLADQVTTRVT